MAIDAAMPDARGRSDLRPWFQTAQELPAPLDPRALFGNDHPLELEIGSGRGLFLVNAGTACPDRNFLGVECDFKEARRAARRLQKRALPNVIIVGADARLFLPRWLPESCAAAMHVYFPDPWWKRRHKKRRIFTAEFVDQAARVLLSAGLLHVWTDVAEYMEVIRRLVDQHAAFAAVDPPAERAPRHDMDYQTSFERKKRKLGVPIHRACWQRLPAAGPERPAGNFASAIAAD
jgi:tRNA (guanine-N7-)-methyltransferase